MEGKLPVCVATNWSYNRSTNNLFSRHPVCPNIVVGYTEILSCQNVYAIVAVEYCTDLCNTLSPWGGQGLPWPEEAADCMFFASFCDFR